MFGVLRRMQCEQTQIMHKLESSTPGLDIMIYAEDWHS